MQFVWVFLLAGLAFGASEADFFESKVRPVLAANCYGCHSSKVGSGNLKLDSRESALRTVKPGDPDNSLLVQVIRRTHAKIKMPPGAPLPPESVEAIASWVKSGAVWPESAAASSAPAADYWAFRPLAKPIGSIDKLWRSALDAKKITPAPPASKHALLRRITLDMTGLPPTPAEVDSFLSDTSPKAYEKVVDRLLASPHYGVRYARLWLDLARYSDGALAAGVDTPYPNAWRYRDWVVDAFNKDMPYPTFVKAQVAADLLPENQDLLAGLGFQALSSSAHDQTDTTAKVFLGLTVGCAQCHDHKYDPIPTRDYYSLYGIFRSSKSEEHALVNQEEVKRYKEQKAKIDAQKEIIAEYLLSQQNLVTDVLVRHTARYMMNVWKGIKEDPTLDAETLTRWHKYLGDPNKEHPYLKPWYDVVNKPGVTEAEVRKAAEDYQQFLFQLIDDQKEVQDKNYVAFGGKKGMKDERTRQYTNIVSLPVLKYYQWREIASAPYRTDGFSAPAGILYYSTKEVERFITGFHKAHLDQLRSELAALEKDLPPLYPFLHTLKDSEKPEDAKIQIRGEPRNLGDVAPRQFLSCLSNSKQPITKGSGRLELAEAIAAHPITARVIANRLWQWHFGNAIVRTPSNFGRNGEAPTHPALLDYLAALLVENKGSLKSLHREILLSQPYRLSAASNPQSLAADASNGLFWRFPPSPRLDFETLRDTILSVSGALDPKLGGPAEPMTDKHHRRSLYLTVSRTRLDPTMALFDFPDPNATAEKRTVTVGPLQGLYFLNSDFVKEQSKAMAERIPAGNVEKAYRMILARDPSPEELRLGREYGANWAEYLQVLMSSAEFLTRP
ncbi:MAG: PSD1 domain-containing protein [Bryobacterales bacterium]|nr:PSD1 domain-containing protein [Bryobacterales bacterium]